jgi:hypothetical protein
MISVSANAGTGTVEHRAISIDGSSAYGRPISTFLTIAFEYQPLATYWLPYLEALSQYGGSHLA